VGSVTLPSSGACRAAFVNAGILGHRAVAGLLAEAVGRIAALEAVHVDLSGDLSLVDRGIRRLLSVPLAPRSGPAANLDLRRWRQQLNAGLLARRRLGRAEREGRFDLLHFHTQATAYASLGRMTRTPTIVSIDATEHLARGEAPSPWSRASYAPNVAHDGLVFRRAAAIVATSDWAGRDLTARDERCADKLHVMPYPVRRLADRSWIAGRFVRSRRPDHRVRLLFVGGDFPRKGGPELLAVWQQGGFADRATLDLVSDWPLGGADLPRGVRLVRSVAPHTAAWVALWREADLFVMPTRQEAFGLVFQEAAAAGIPAIGTRISAVPEIIEDDRTGRLVAPGDAEGLARAMRALIDSAEDRRRMGEAALDRAEALWSMDRYATRLGALIDRLVARDRRLSAPLDPVAQGVDS
jgi:glycosyltransferase involved in cell wall biosynthesis